MAGLHDISNFIQLHKRMQKSLGVNLQLSEILGAQKRIKKTLGDLNMVAELAKSMQQHHGMVVNPTLSAIKAITKELSSYAKLSIPQATLDSILFINRQHEQLFENMRSLMGATNKYRPDLYQINSWQLAISGISGQLAAIAARQEKWDLIDDFEEITEEVVSLNERIFDKNGVTKDGLNELKELFQRIEIKVDKIDTDANALFWKLLALMSFVLAVIGEGRNWLPKPEYATKQEIEKVIKEQFVIYEKKLRADKEFRITNRVCKVMSKPRLKSLVIEKLPIDFEVTVLQVNNKWIYVSYFSPSDNLPHTGWIMKKYLVTPE